MQGSCIRSIGCYGIPIEFDSDERTPVTAQRPRIINYSAPYAWQPAFPVGAMPRGLIVTPVGLIMGPF